MLLLLGEASLNVPQHADLTSQECRSAFPRAGQRWQGDAGQNQITMLGGPAWPALTFLRFEVLKLEV